jgi:MarR family 2-MHQ and catechol resistance regulon transcriptional repressor
MDKSLSRYIRSGADALDHALTKYLRRTRELDESTIPAHITTVKGLILRIIYRYGTCTVKDVAYEIALSPSATTTALNKLEQEGLIIRTRDANDRRIVWLSLSEIGKDVTFQMMRNREAIIDGIFHQFTEEEKSLFLHLLEKIDL